MTVIAVDEVMLREPRLLVPGMQPLGSVVASDLARRSGAALVAVLNKPQSLGGCRNLIDNVIGCTTLIAGPAVTPAGIGVLYSTSGYFPGFWLGGKELVTTGPFSALWHGVANANTNGYPCFHNSGGNEQWGLRANWLANGDATGSQTANAAALLIYSTTFSGVGATNAFVYGKPFTMLGVRDGTSLKLFVDGRLAASATATQRNVSGSTAHQIGVKAWKAAKYTTPAAFGGETGFYPNDSTDHMVAFWPSALSDGAACAISNDPYSLVAPA